MGDPDAGRDWEVLKYISRLPDDSYNAVLRDITFSNGETADLARYRHQGFEWEIFDVYDPSIEREEGAKMIESLRAIVDFLNEAGFDPRVATKRTDNIRNEELVVLEGNYYLDADINDEAVSHLQSVLEGDIYQDFDKIRCKK